MAKNKVSRRKLLAGSWAAAASGMAASGAEGGGPDRAEQPQGGIWERPPDQRDRGNRRNLILLNVDTFRADNLQCYGGNGLVQCPRLDRFAEDSVIFDDVYPEGMPTIPTRRVLWTGRRILPLSYYHQHEPVQLPGWHELFYEDQTLAETLHESDYHTVLIADIPHLQRPGKNFHRGYRYCEWVRGHEVDYYAQAPHQTPDLGHIFPESYLKLPELDNPRTRWFLNQYNANRRRYEKECEALIELTAKNVIGWLKRNHAESPFFLHMEAFDPHEPWDPPKRFLDPYLPNAEGPAWWEPPYADIEVPEDGVKRLRANYAGESMCVDYWVGEILTAIEELGLYDNSIVVFTSDHGALLGEQGQFLKGPERIRGQVTHNPLLVRLPNKEQGGKHVKGFVHHPDIVPTLMGLLGLDPPPRATGNNVWPLVKGETNSFHDYLVQGYGWIGAVRTVEWNFSRVVDPERYQKEYKPQLYNLEKDPQELTNVADQYPDVVNDLSAKLIDYIEAGNGLTGGSFHAREGHRPPEEHASLTYGR